MARWQCLMQGHKRSLCEAVVTLPSIAAQILSEVSYEAARDACALEMPTLVFVVQRSGFLPCPAVLVCVLQS